MKLINKDSVSHWGFDFFFDSFLSYQDKRNEHRLVGQKHLDFLQNLSRYWLTHLMVHCIITFVNISERREDRWGREKEKVVFPVTR